ncbi:DUF4194 domain-containing protein [Salmonella enterica]|uniref:DUF4194 domain-containing protein n=1 Tax=Salmonella newport TaxID=108619 RepID=A0A5Y0S819_SALNE|nr:DUF4194 domain-containing protein [Salmonella enterica]EBS4088850.1 DUF4194 domain-containing protein [Salmonella enterica subsp. enterica serovar Newport]EBS4408717.1 DUF4194 domain-containing protein [Salmonella enterica subsp. enterica serovar Newport]EBV0464756.1 DUF4194 domain-containing protein [Salmonella enterica subsp. enterica serovar Newport]EBX1212437.1 DUF4194 domain-containing protein [Salmonella enterica subsp. enterica serovar Newport]
MIELFNSALFSEDARNLSSRILIRLLKGPLYRSRHRDLWEVMVRDQQHIRSYFQPLGLMLTLDEAEGFAFLVQQQFEGDDDFPRLIPKRNLTFAQSVLLVSLRKRLAEHDAEEGAPRLIVTRQEIYSWLKPYLPEVNNEVKQNKDLDALIKRVSEMGFLSVLIHHPDEFEVLRIIKAIVTVAQIDTFTQLFREQNSVQEAEYE